MIRQRTPDDLLRARVLDVLRRSFETDGATSSVTVADILENLAGCTGIDIRRILTDLHRDGLSVPGARQGTGEAVHSWVPHDDPPEPEMWPESHEVSHVYMWLPRYLEDSAFVAAEDRLIELLNRACDDLPLLIPHARARVATWAD